MSREILIEHNGVEYGGQIGTIKSTSLGYEFHGILTASLTIEWSGGGVSVGGFCLDEPKDREGRDYSRRGTAYGLDHIIRIIETVGVERWEDLQGRQVIVLFEGRSAWGAHSVGLANTTDDSKVLVLGEHAALWREGAEL
ncbi:hypothetical protein [Agromyces sp. NBRC 114283]|uniref:hypothetical protein n=1 Tax=Agromyces sp. NBRC 114283 TaxID=2994521 RepID=UPI0024A51343|nr:hypothetical protein [Agromyces sp. NBRC 114283]GLU91309.1 hypothetical protein Agsp01_35640 [Agromyces sp. NBRC 114283]